MGYRTPAPEGPAAPSRLARIACFFAGHRWVVFRVHNVLLAHLGPTCGADARCTRCGTISMWGGYRQDEGA